MDRREFHRFSVELELRYRILESLKPYTVTTTDDMSEKGVRITLLEYIEPETRLEITIRLPGQEQPIVSIGRVAWVRQDEIGNCFIAGVHLVHIMQKDRERLYRCAFF